MTRTKNGVGGARLEGERIFLRPCTLDDCTERYVGWLEDPEVNRYLETRWVPQTLASVRSFVASITDGARDHLFAIVERATDQHVGNLKVGAVADHHAHADVSYFIGDRRVWGRGLATEAVRLATAFGFEQLGLHRLQAGFYESNTGSQRVLEKAGYVYEARLRKQLRGPTGWEDHVWFGALRDEWR